MDKIRRAGPAWRRALKVALVVTVGAVVLAVGGVAWGAPMGLTRRVSISTMGAQGNANTLTSAISANGRYVVFTSAATNLVPGDTNAAADIFVYDTLFRITTRVSMSDLGAQANAGSWDAYISADGRYVVFGSIATNLVPNDTNGDWDVFVRDRVLGTTRRVSVSSAGVQGNGASYAMGISDDGSRILMLSTASNLVPWDTNGSMDAFVRDTVANTTKRVSITSNGAQAMAYTGGACISGDGNHVVFASTGVFVPGDTKGKADVFMRDLAAGTTTVISTGQTPGGWASGNSASPSVSRDGSVVAFQSDAPDIVSTDPNGTLADVFVAYASGGKAIVSLGLLDAPANGPSLDPCVSADGKKIVFQSVATNLVSADTNGMVDVFVRDLAWNDTKRVSLGFMNVQANNTSFRASCSENGDAIVFCSNATNLVLGDTNAFADVFLRNEYGPIKCEPEAGGTTWTRWIPGKSAAYSNNDYVYSRWANTSLHMSAAGSRIDWIGPKQPNYGKADVYLDGVYNATVDQYAPAATATTSATIWSSPALTGGLHTVDIYLRGAKNPASGGYVTVVDRFDVWAVVGGAISGRLDERGATSTFTGGWIKSANTTYFNGGYAYSYWPGHSCKFAFLGTKVAWIGPKFYNYGQAAVYVDGVYKGTISQYAPASATAFRAKVWESASMTRGIHTLEIRPLGTKVPASSGAVIVLDAFDVTP